MTFYIAEGCLDFVISAGIEQRYKHSSAFDDKSRLDLSKLNAP